MLGLKDAQRKQALLSSIKNDNNNLTEAFRDNVVLDYAGFKAQDMDQRQMFELLQLISMFIYNMEAGHGKVKMEEVFQRLDNTYFAWIGGTEAQGVYYYRIHRPVWRNSQRTRQSRTTITPTSWFVCPMATITAKTCYGCI